MFTLVGPAGCARYRVRGGAAGFAGSGAKKGGTAAPNELAPSGELILLPAA